ncbi:MAG: site-specific integrase [Chitinophagaceae bacterium]
MSLYLLIYLKRCKVNTQKKSPLFLRISLNGQRTEIALRRFIDPEQWDNIRQCVRGRNEQAASINQQIESYKLAIHNHHSRLVKNGEQITAHSLKSAFLGIDKNKKSLIEAFTYHNLKIKEQVGKGYALGTYKRFETTLKLVKEFIDNKYKIDDIILQNIDLEFITEFDYYLRVVRCCCNNTTVKYIKNFQKIINLAISLSWLENNPFKNYKCKIESVDRDILHEHEIEAILNKNFSIERLTQVKDIFLFACYTGLAYADVQKLTNDNLIIGSDGGNWIQVNRTKTNSLSRIPVLQIPQIILNKYRYNPYCLKFNKLLPVLSNQKMNAYLKEIADMCNIQKHLTFHVARHTFATTVTLSNKVPIESVSKMLGHKSIKTTQHYSKVLDQKISEDMNALRLKYSSKTLLSQSKIA